MPTEHLLIYGLTVTYCQLATFLYIYLFLCLQITSNLRVYSLQNSDNIWHYSCVFFIFSPQQVIILPAEQSWPNTPQVHKLYQKYQIAVHNDTPSRLTTSSFERFLVRSPFKVNIQLKSIFNFYSSTHPKIYHSNTETSTIGQLRFLSKS